MQMLNIFAKFHENRTLALREIICIIVLHGNHHVNKLPK